MASVINTNVASLNAQRNLTTSQSSLTTSLQRLSSGLRINSAKDDAAGLAISDRFTTQIRGLNQASRNANDAISLSQTAEGALGELSTNLQRIRELAVQSANATNSASDRAALDLEVQQRLAEIDRISSTTAFNGQKILDGTFGNAAFQVGANVGETIALDLSTSMRIGALATATSVDLETVIYNGTPGRFTTYGLNDFVGTDLSVDGTGGTSATFTVANDDTKTTGDYSGVGKALTFNIGNLLVQLTGNYTGGDNTATIATDIQTELDAEFFPGWYSVEASGFEIVITNNFMKDAIDLTNSSDLFSGFINSAGNLGTVGTSTFKVGDKTVTLDGFYSTRDDLVAKIQADLGADYSVSAQDDIVGPFIEIITVATGSTVPAPVSYPTPIISLITGVGSGGFFYVGVNTPGSDDTASITVNNDFSIQLGTAPEVAVANGQYSTAQDLVDAVNSALAGNASAVLNDDGTMSIFSDEAVTITGTTGLTTLGLASQTPVSGNLSSTNVLDLAASNETISRIDAALGSVSDLRSTFGAVQNRFESTISNLGTAVENLSAARSRILDADFASETANLTRAQILQQAGTAMLSQANALPQNVLSLLG